MEETRNEKIEAIREGIEKLPEKMQKAVIMAINHWDVVELICKETRMTNEEIKKLKVKAREKEDYFFLVLLCAVQAFNNSGETSGTEERGACW